MHLPASIFKVYIETLTGFIHLSTPDSLNITFKSHGCTLEAASWSGGSKKNAQYNDRIEVEETSGPFSQATDGYEF